MDAVSYPRAYLSDLLALIHRDGGHYEQQHGLEKAMRDACSKLLDERDALSVTLGNIRSLKGCAGPGVIAYDVWERVVENALAATPDATQGKGPCAGTSRPNADVTTPVDSGCGESAA